MKFLSFVSLFIILLANPFNVNAQEVGKNASHIKCNTWDCLEKNKNKDAVIKGVFRKYTPNKTGKGAQQMFWDWEILLSDGHAVPVKKMDNKIDYKSFEGKKVSVKGHIFYGIIIGNSGEQNAKGFRIDPLEIKRVEK